MVVVVVVLTFVFSGRPARCNPGIVIVWLIYLFALDFTLIQQVFVIHSFSFILRLQLSTHKTMQTIQQSIELYFFKAEISSAMKLASLLTVSQCRFYLYMVRQLIRI